MVWSKGFDCWRFRVPKFQGSKFLGLSLPKTLNLGLRGRFDLFAAFRARSSQGSRLAICLHYCSWFRANKDYIGLDKA